MQDDTGGDYPDWWVILGSTPIVLDLEGDSFEFTGLQDTVFFDLNHDGSGEWITWTHPESDEAFVVLDRHGNLLRWSSLVHFGDKRRLGAVDVIFQVQP